LKILVLYNPVSGAGRAAAGAQQAKQWLKAAGHEVSLVQTSKEPTSTWLDEPLSQHQALIVAGGDGTVRMAAESSCRTPTPMYQLPLGTENLLAREFGMENKEAALIGAIKRFQVQAADVGSANADRFLLMASVGFDAEVAHELAVCRGESISLLTYLRPMWSCLLRWQPPHLQISVDGVRIDDGGSGFVIVANSRHYGFRFNPCDRASMCDGKLDVAYFPAASRRQLIDWALRCRTRRQFRHPKFVYTLGRKVTIISKTRQRYQLDGDPAGLPYVETSTRPESSAGLWQLDIEVRPGALPVLVP
jgi:diacylglycerol kinase family enzyme